MKRSLILLLLASLAAGCTNNAFQQTAIDHYVAGQMAADRQDFQAALAELSKAVQNDPKLSVAHAAMGDIYRKQGDYQQAADAYEKSCNLNPYGFRPHYNLGVTCQMLAAAAKTAQAAGDCLQKAVNAYLRAVTIKADDFDATLNLSACYFQQGKYDLAEQYCKTAIGLNPDSPFGYSNMAIIYDAQNRPYEAINYYNKSLERDTHQPKLLLNLGSTYVRLKRYKEALKDFELAAREDPRSAAPYEQIGSCQFHQQKYDEALAAYEKALEIDAKSAAAYRGVGVVYMTQYLMDNTKAELKEKALTAWTQSLVLDSNQPDLVKLVEKYAPKKPAVPEL